MAVVPDRRTAITHKLKMLKTNQAIVTAALEKLLVSVAPLPAIKEEIDGEQQQQSTGMEYSTAAAPGCSSAAEPDMTSLSLSNNGAPATVSKTAAEERMPSANSFLEANAFTIRDMNSLLKNLESEILVNEQNLNDENEKRNMFKVDDCRRTHNYDEFICTFLQMLAHQGALAELVSQSISRKSSSGGSNNRGGNSIVRQQQPYKKSDRTKKSPGKRRKGRNKYKKK